MTRRTGIVVLLGVLILVGSASADIFRGRFRVGRYMTVEQGGQMTWAQIAAQTGVRTAVEMASAADIATGGTGTTVIQDFDAGSGGPYLSYDAAKNALRVSIPAAMGAPGIAWTQSLAYANQFDEGSDIWFQVDMQMDAGWLTPSNGGGGPKMFTLDEGIQSDGYNPGSCDNGGAYPMHGQIYMGSNVSTRNPAFPTLVTLCGNRAAYEYYADGDIGLENKMLGPGGVPVCTYRRVNAGTDGCFRLNPNVWYTFTMHLHVGTWAPCDSDACAATHNDSQVDLWVSHTGLTAPVYLISVKNYPLVNLSPGQGRLGKIWLFPNDYGRVDSTVDANVWYRRVVLGSAPLKDPTTGLVLVPEGDTPGTPPPSTLVATYLGTGVDKTGQLSSTPNGINDFRVSVTGLRGTPNQIRITNQGTGQSGTWEYPANGVNWLVYAEYGGGGANTGDFWFDPWQESLTHVKVFYADGTTDEADAAPPGAPSTRTLTIAKTGTGTVSSSVPGGAISCGGDCTETITTGTAFTMSATPGTNHIFSGWAGGGCSGTGACSLTLNADTTITAMFSNTQTPGNLASIPVNGWLKMTPALSSRYVISGSFQCGQQVVVADTATPGAYESKSSPINKGYSGIQYGGGKILYWGGGHEKSGNSAEVYDPYTNKWTESFKPEVCSDICNVQCGAIYSGSSSPNRTPLNRPYGEQSYHRNPYNPLNGLWYLMTRGVGPWTYSEATQQILEIPLTQQSNGQYWPWSSDIGYHGAIFAPDLSDILYIITSAGGSAAGIWRQNDRAGLAAQQPSKWQKVGEWPTDRGIPYNTYVTTLGKHLITVVGDRAITSGSVNQCVQPRAFYWLHTPTMTWSARITMSPSAVQYATMIEYDSLHNKLVAIDDCNQTNVRMWVATPVDMPSTPVWTEITMTAAVPSVLRNADTTGMNPLLQFDPVNNVFWYLYVPPFNGAVDLWAYRLQ